MAKQPAKIKELLDDLDMQSEKLENHHRFKQIPKEIEAITNEMIDIQAHMKVIEDHAKAIGMTPKKMEKKMKELNEDLYLYKSMLHQKEKEKKSIEAEFNYEKKLLDSKKRYLMQYLED